MCPKDADEKANIVDQGPVVQKITTSLVNETLKFQTLISQIPNIFMPPTSEKLRGILVWACPSVSDTGILYRNNLVNKIYLKNPFG